MSEQDEDYMTPELEHSEREAIGDSVQQQVKDGYFRNDELVDKLQKEAQARVAAIQLTDEQQTAITTILEWMKLDSSPQEFKLGGYAGTGKTTLVKSLLKELRKTYCVRVVAFTGKAVNVLMRKGVDAQTIHSLIYQVDVDPKTKLVTFHKKWKIEGQPDLIIVDESSMVSTEQYNDLRSFKTKLLFVGDPGQLEPVGDNPNLMLLPDIVLSKIHRQAESSPIITLASRVRLGAGVHHPFGPEHENFRDLEVKPKQLNASEACLASQVICAKNKTRTGMNDMMRKYLQRSAQPLVEGEKIIVLRNNRNFLVFNGMILFVEKIREDCHDHWLIDAKDEVGNVMGELPIWKGPFLNPVLREQKDLQIPAYRKEQGKFSSDERGMTLVYADYAYVITCHKSQGSEWEHVIVYDEYMPPKIWDMRRWRYTAITRASKKLTYLI